MMGGARIGLGVDAGGSATRWVLRREGDDQPLASGEAGPASGHIFDPKVREKTLASFATLIADVSRIARPDAIAAGITGLGAGTPPALTLSNVLADGFGLHVDKVAAGDDMWIIYHALYAPGAGAIVYSGTGSIGYAIRADGQALKIGGYGVLLDDAGSAFWIAREVIRRTLRARDEDPALRSLLADALYARIGGSSWAIIREAVYSGDRGAIAALAPAVAEAARMGDADALRILEEAGAELARLAAILGRRGSVSHVSLVGGAAKLHPAIGDAFQRALPAGLTGSLAQPNAAAAAAALALSGQRPPREAA